MLPPLEPTTDMVGYMARKKLAGVRCASRWC